MRASGYDRVENDWYVEPRWAIDRLLDVEKFEGTTLDPSCGGGNIPKAMADRKMFCMASDIADRGFGNPFTDFFGYSRPSFYCDNVISNPPYGVIEDYVRHALKLTDKKVALLARLAFLEGQKRQKLFLETPFARVWVSSKRMSMPPGGGIVDAKGGAIAYAWFVWEHGYVGKPTLGWI